MIVDLLNWMSNLTDNITYHCAPISGEVQSIHFLKEDLKATIFPKSLKIIERDQVTPNII